MGNTFTIRDLMARYTCARSTIYRLMKYEDYPLPAKVSKLNKWSVVKVFAWERIHAPHLHPTTDEVAAVEEAQMWEKVRADYEKHLAGDTVPERAKKARKGKSWEEVAREGREVIEQLKTRHEKPVARPRA